MQHKLSPRDSALSSIKSAKLAIQYFSTLSLADTLSITSHAGSVDNSVVTLNHQDSQIVVNALLASYHKIIQQACIDLFLLDNV